MKNFILRMTFILLGPTMLAWELGLITSRSPPLKYTYDFTGQNVSLLKKYPKGNFLDSNGMFFAFSAPKRGGVLMKTFPKPSFTHFSQKNGPQGGVFYQISPDVAPTTCIQLYSKRTQRANLSTPTACFFDSAPPK